MVHHVAVFAEGTSSQNAYITKERGYILLGWLLGSFAACFQNFRACCVLLTKSFNQEIKVFRLFCRKRCVTMKSIFFQTKCKIIKSIVLACRVSAGQKAAVFNFCRFTSKSRLPLKDSYIRYVGRRKTYGKSRHPCGVPVIAKKNFPHGVLEVRYAPETFDGPLAVLTIPEELPMLDRGFCCPRWTVGGDSGCLFDIFGSFFCYKIF